MTDAIVRSAQHMLATGRVADLSVSTLLVGLMVIALAFVVVPRIWDTEDKPLVTGAAVGSIGLASYLGSRSSTVVQLMAAGIGMLVAMVIFEVFRPVQFPRLKAALRRRRATDR